MTSKPTTTTDYGGLVGTVKDESGNPVAGATVVASSESTGQPHITTTNPSGNFAVLDLVPDVYKLKIEKAAYETFEAMGIRVVADEWQTSAYTLKAYTPPG